MKSGLFNNMKGLSRLEKIIDQKAHESDMKNANDRQLKVIMKFAFKKEQEFIIKYVKERRETSKAQSIKGNWHYRRYWSRQNGKLAK